MMNSKPIIPFEVGWNNNIEKGIKLLEDFLNNGTHVVVKENGKTTSKLFNERQYVEIYTLSYDMCTQRTPYNWSELLYQKHGEVIGSYLCDTVFPSIKTCSGIYLLREVERRWNNHITMNLWLRNFFMYLDRFHVKNNNIPSLSEAAMTLFGRCVFIPIKTDLTNSMIALITDERESSLGDVSISMDASNQDVLRECVGMYIKMGNGTFEAYTEHFEEPLLTVTKDFYAVKADAWINSMNGSDYMLKVEEVVEFEKQRVKNYLISQTESKLMMIIDKEMLSNKQSDLLEKEGSGCRHLLMTDSLTDLARMYRLFVRIPNALQAVADIFKAHLASVGNQRIDQAVASQSEITDSKKKSTSSSGDKEKTPTPDAEDGQIVKDLIALYDKYSTMISIQFQGNGIFRKAFKEAFVEFLNRDMGNLKTAEILSSFTDRLLRSGGEKLSAEEVESYLEKVVQLFIFLTDKDIFSDIYRNQLAKRLLNSRSASDEMEKTMIGKLKMSCGSQYTSKIEGMLNDLSVAADHAKDFKEYCGTKVSSSTTPAGSSVFGGKTQFEVKVLTCGNWPTYKYFETIVLPPVMAKCVQVFQDFYDFKTQGRRLAWYHSLGNVSVKGNFGKRTFELNVTTLQAIVLLCFNTGAASEIKSFESLRDSLSMPEEALKRTLHSLSCGKFKVLKKMSAASSTSTSDDPKEKESIAKAESKSVKVTDSFVFNEAFNSPLRNIRIPMASLEDSHNPKKVEEDRTHAIEAAIVRVMKARKTFSHQQLIAEVLTQLSFFRPDPKAIKKSIEVLIERDYLERDEVNVGTYKYLA